MQIARRFKGRAMLVFLSTRLIVFPSVLRKIREKPLHGTF